MYESQVREGVLRVARPGTRWLSTGVAGGLRDADAAYNISVPEGWTRRDLRAYVERRRERAGFAEAGPALLTGVDLEHLRAARSGPVVVYATAGLSNPAALPMVPASPVAEGAVEDADDASSNPPAGTVNLLVGTGRSIDDAALASLLAVVVEAKAATLLAETGYPGTTTDAAIVGTAPDGEPARFTGSATPVGAAARACTREAVRASLHSRYADRSLPESVDEAAHGTSTERRAEVFRP